MAITPITDGQTAIWMVCPDCRGKGVHTLHGYAYTAADVDELGPEFLEDMHDGLYDTVCETCRGRTTIRASEYEGFLDGRDMAATMRYESGIYS